MNLSSRTFACLGLLASASCSWGRFDDLRKDAPVIALDPIADVVSGFGSTAIALAGDQSASVVIGAAPGASGAGIYSVGSTGTPTTQPFDSSYCPRRNSTQYCLLAETPATLPSLDTGQGVLDACFVAGAGRIGKYSGLWMRCASQQEYVLPTPAPFVDGVVAPGASSNQVPAVALATSSGADRHLVVGVGALGYAFHYAPGSTTPQDLVVGGGVPESFGSSVAVLDAEPSAVLAISAPKVGEIRLFSVDSGTATYLGCLAGLEGFGSHLESGDLDGDSVDELFVTTPDSVRWYSGQDLAGLSENTDAGCTLALDEADILLGEVRCQNRGEVRDCSGSRFGKAVQVADFDGDGQTEVAVAAARVTVRGEGDAGAIFVFDADGEQISLLYPSTPHKSGHFGEAMQALAQDQGAILVAGEPGRNSASLLYCVTDQSGGTSAHCD